MCPSLSAVFSWLRTNEWLALWLEGLALVAIFGLELAEYKRQGQERKDQHDESVKQMKIMQSQADALVNSERAWVIAELIPICRMIAGNWHRPTGTGSWVGMDEDAILRGDYLQHTLRCSNMGRTPAHILRYQISYSCLDKGVTNLAGGIVAKQDSIRVFDHLLPATERTDVPEIVDVHGYINERIAGIAKLEYTAVLHGWVEYLSVFNDSNVLKASFCYLYKPSIMGLERVPEDRIINQDR